MTQKDDLRNRFQIGRALPGDEAAIAEIERTCFSRPWSEDAIREELKRPDCVFLKAVDGDGVCLGYINCRIVLDEAYIGNLAVAPDQRRRGIGSALLYALRNKAETEGCAFLSLEVRVSNSPARSLYEQAGFRLMGERKRFYSAPTEDAAIYTIHFKESEA